MKAITEVPDQLVSLRRRTIRSLATDDIKQEDCTYITKRLDEIIDRIDHINDDSEES